MGFTCAVLLYILIYILCCLSYSECRTRVVCWLTDGLNCNDCNEYWKASILSNSIYSNVIEVTSDGCGIFYKYL